MANYRPLKKSFAGGEITPELAGRIDLPKHQAGVEKCQNMIVLPHGPLISRPGFEFIFNPAANHSADNKIRLIPFIYSTSQTYVLAIVAPVDGVNGVAHIMSQGAPVLETRDTGVISAVSTNSVTAVCADSLYVGALVQLTMATNPNLDGKYFQVYDYNYTTNLIRLKNMDGSVIDPSFFTGFTSGIIKCVAGFAHSYNSADLFDLNYVQSADVLTITHQNYAPYKVQRIGGGFTRVLHTFTPGITAPTGLTETGTVKSGGVSYYYVVTAVRDNGREESSQSGVLGIGGQNLSVAGNYNVINWASVSGAIRYNVYKNSNGLYGFAGQTAALTFKDENIKADTTTTPPETKTPFNYGNNPRAVTYYEQRKAFGGGLNAPQTLWLTGSGTESNLNFSIPQQDNDGIEITIASREAHTIRHLVPLSDLLVLTTGGEWRCMGASDSALTPASIQVKPQSYIGASPAQPVVTGNTCIFVADRGSHFREVSLDWQTSAYKTLDLNIMAPHLVDGFNISDVAFSKTPIPVVWATRADGVLLGLTYLPDQQIIAWHRHVTDGTIESVCSIPEGEEDAVYLVVNRNINGINKRYIERMKTLRFATQEDAFLVDSGLTYIGAAATTISGLSHLEGETVAVVGDGKVQTNKVVAGGSITLDAAASKVHIGLPFTQEVITLTPVVEGAADFAQGRQMNINKVIVHILRSGLISAGPKAGIITQQPLPPGDIGSLTALQNERVEIVLSGNWNNDGQILIRNDKPQPLTIIALAAEFAIGG